MLLLQTTLLFAGLFLRVSASSTGVEYVRTINHNDSIQFFTYESASGGDSFSVNSVSLIDILVEAGVPNNLDSYSFEVCSVYSYNKDGADVTYNISLADFNFNYIDDDQHYSLEFSCVTDNEWSRDGINVFFSYIFDIDTEFASSTDYSLVYSSYNETNKTLNVTPTVGSIVMNFNCSAIPQSVLNIILNGAVDDNSYKDGYNYGYNEGYNDGNKYGYNHGYNVGHSAGYSSGYTEGYRTGLTQTGTPNFMDLFASIADTPVLMVRKLFSFDLFGTSALTIIMSLFSALVLIWVLKKLVK